jgi:hypothetical protein
MATRNYVVRAMVLPHFAATWREVETSAAWLSYTITPDGLFNLRVEGGPNEHARMIRLQRASARSLR